MKTILKKNIGIIAVLMAQMFFFNSCESNSIRSKIKGAWEYEYEDTARLDENHVGKIFFKGVDLYHENGTSNEQATVTIVLDCLNTEDGVSFLVKLKYDMSYEGKWKVENGFIVENGTSVSSRLVDSDLTAFDTDDGEELFLDEELKRKITKEYIDAFEDLNHELKKDIQKQEKTRVVSITESQMILKDEDGELTTYKRIE